MPARVGKRAHSYETNHGPLIRRVVDSFGMYTTRRTSCARPTVCTVLVALAAVVPSRLGAQQDDAAGRFVSLLGAQATAVLQHLAPFTAPYSGPNSLTHQGATQSSISLGAYLGARVTSRLELYLDAELLRGRAVGDGHGVAAIPNGDVVAPSPDAPLSSPFVARAFARYVIPLPGARQHVDPGIDQLPGMVPERRIELKLGKLAVTDDFDANRYANNARAQFLNWGLFSNTAFDYAADTRGYAVGATAAYVAARWSLRAGRYLMPADGLGWRRELADSRSDIVQLSATPGPHRTSVRVFVFENRGSMSAYKEALAATPRSLDTVVRPDARKRGAGVNIEQPLSEHGNFGVLLRGGWNDGRTDGFATSEVDRHASVATQYRLRRWLPRHQDIVGFGLARHWLSEEHRAYLEAGGTGFFLGDGALTYTPETIVEGYYRAQVGSHLQFGPDVQLVRHPGYNATHGAAVLIAARVHAEL